MSRKDFELIAKTLRDLRKDENTPTGQPAELWSITALRFAHELKTTHPQFNQEHFLKACGY